VATHYCLLLAEKPKGKGKNKGGKGGKKAGSDDEAARAALAEAFKNKASVKEGEAPAEGSGEKPPECKQQ
jgi:hypothetical protein